MNNKEFIAQLSSRTGYTKLQTQRMVSDIVTEMSDSFMEGDTVTIGDFGQFEVKKKMERIIANPATGIRMLVPPKLVLGFKASSAWKESRRNGGAHEQ